MDEHVILYQHTKRPEWGYGAVIETADDRTTYGFDDGSRRTIRHDHMHMMSQAEPDEAEGAEIRKRIAKHWASRAAAGTAVRSRKTSAAKKASSAARAKSDAPAERPARKK